MAKLAEVSDSARLLPQDLDAEDAVLGAMMLAPGAIATVSEILAPGDFYRQSNGKIFAAARGLYARGEPADAITIADALAERGDLDEVGGRGRIQELAALVPASANAGHWARVIREASVLRGLVRVGQKITAYGFDRGAEAETLVSRAEQLIYELSESRSSGELVPVKDSLVESFARLSELYESGATVTGVPTGFTALDDVTSGLQKSNLVVLAARPGMGKSALALSIAASVATKQELPCAFFSLEMSRQEVAQRLMCMEAKVDSHAIRTGRLGQEDWPRLAAACGLIETKPLYVDDTPALSLIELRSRLQTLKRREPNLALAVVDYLQLMTTGDSTESRLQEVSSISRGLKSIAKDLDLPILALSQLSRAVEQRHDKRPQLADLRESGTIEQDSDVVMFIYRDDYYDQESESQGVAEVHVAKNRHGPTDGLKLAFLRRYAKFAPLQP